MQPAQLSLLPDLAPAPAPTVLAVLGEHDLGEAISLLGSLIAKLSLATLPGKATAKAETRGDE